MSRQHLLMALNFGHTALSISYVINKATLDKQHNTQDKRAFTRHCKSIKRKMVAVSQAIELIKRIPEPPQKEYPQGGHVPLKPNTEHGEFI